MFFDSERWVCAEATLRRRWPSRLKLKKSMKGIQERILRLHLPHPRATGAASAAAGATGATGADSAARCADDEDSAEHVQGVKRPLPFSSRAALLQNPPRRPKVDVCRTLQCLGSTCCADIYLSCQTVQVQAAR